MEDIPLQDTDKEMEMWESNYECDCLETSILEREDLSFHYRIQIKKWKCGKTIMSVIAWRQVFWKEKI